MTFGKTKQDTTGIFRGEITRFDIPAGTPVTWGLPDCDGDPFPQWALTSTAALELSGNVHDSRYRFVTVSAENVEIEEPQT